MSFGEKIKKLREYLSLTQEAFANRIGLKKSHISMVERGERGLSFDQLSRIAQTYHMDARWFFGQLDSVEEADLSKRGDPSKSITETFIEQLQRQNAEIEELRRHVKPVSEVDPLAKSVMTNPEIRAIVTHLQNLDGAVLREVQGLIYGYLSRFRDDNEEPKSGVAG
jgi:transcriptional regulator with XRE-family HTH domain